MSKSFKLTGIMGAVMSFAVCCFAQEAEEESINFSVDEPTVTATSGPKLAIELGAPFCDNAVLQREMEMPVWGWSKPGTQVTVEFSGQKKTATAGKDGKWLVKLDKMKASFDPAQMVITEVGGKSVTLKNILVGEVWLASGQSNMQLKVGGVDTMKLANEFKSKVKEPVIREFEVTSVFAMLHPIEKATGSWKNGDYENYSAIAFAFAQKLYEELHVPVGILNCSFSQTAIQAWVPRQGFATGEDEYTKAIHQKCLMTDPSTPEFKAAWDNFYKSLESQIAENEARSKRGEKAKEISDDVPGNMQGNRDANWLFCGRLSPVVPYAIRGGIWNQGYANMNEGLSYYNNLHSLIRGWRLVWNRPDLPVYFHQFYCPGRPEELAKPGIGATSEMRLGTWLARDIPNAGMASQIDISGGVHYVNKTVPGWRLALQALKNVYGKNLVCEGPMVKSYEVKGDQVIVSFDHAQGGLVVGSTEFNRSKDKSATGLSDPKVVENGEGQVKLFWLAGADRVWHPATFKIAGEKVVVSSAAVKEPRGISYGSGGIGFQPCLYNTALLPMTPFIYFDNKMVLSKEWPGGQLKIEGETFDPNAVGKVNEYKKMPLLSIQFCDNAVFQADKPVKVWGSTRKYGEWQAQPEPGKCEVQFEFGDIKKTIAVTPDMEEWNVVIPPMKAGPKPYTLKVRFTVDGELAQERVINNIVFGDVWYVAAPPLEGAVAKTLKKKKGAVDAAEGEPTGPIVRMIENQSNRRVNPRPSRFSISVSRLPTSKYASYWKPATGLAAEIGNRLSAKTGRPVGIIFMQTKLLKTKGMPSVDNTTLSQWISADFLKEAPSLMEDYKIVGIKYPDNPYYLENVRQYASQWKHYWETFIPEMIATKAVPDGKPWGTYPTLTSKKAESDATQVYNIYVCPFAPASLAGIIFLSGQGMVAADQGEHFGEQMTALANCLRTKFDCGDDIPLIYTVPSKTLAPKLTAPAGIKGKSTPVEITRWNDVTGVLGTLK
jgi:hypothetical protein